MKTRPVWHLNVVSSNIKKAAYNFEKHQMMLSFKSGGRYVYKNVSMKEWIAFSKSESQGKWFLQHVKDQKDFKKLDD